MPGPAVVLREIHRLRRFARELQDRIEQLPRRLQAQQGRVAQQEEALRQAQDALKHLKVTTHEKEVTLKTTQQQTKKYEKQLDEAGGKKEYDSLQAEVASARQKMIQLEDEILATMIETEEQTARLPELEKAVREAKAELARVEGEMQTRQTELAEQHRQTLAQIDQVEATLPEGDARNQYERLVKARGEDALVRVENLTCMACYTGITQQQQHNLILELFVLCKNCGRIMYLPE